MHLQLLLSKVYLYLRDAFKSAAVTRRWLCSLWIARCKCMKKGLSLRFKVAESVVAAEISDHLNAFSNISRRGTKINFYLFFLAPSFIPAPQIYLPLHFIPRITPHLQCSGPDFMLHSPKTPIYK